jgi:hypothetical protein
MREDKRKQLSKDIGWVHITNLNPQTGLEKLTKFVCMAASFGFELISVPSIESVFSGKRSEEFSFHIWIKQSIPFCSRVWETPLPAEFTTSESPRHGQRAHPPRGSAWCFHPPTLAAVSFGDIQI